MDDANLPVLNEKTYVKETALALWEGLPRVILAGFLFTLVSLPAILIFLLGFSYPGIILGVFTLGPGWAAMNFMIAETILREPLSLVAFTRAFRKFFLRGSVLAVLFAVPLVAGLGSLPSFLAPDFPGIIWAGLAADVATLFFLAILYLYVFPQMVFYNVGIRLAFRNSFVFASRHFSNSLGLIAMAVLLAILAYKVSLFLLIILPACWSVFVLNNFRMVLRIEFGDNDKADDSGNVE